MKSKVKAILASVVVGVFLSTAGIYLAYASDDCKAGCAIAAKACKKGCGDDLDCKLDCIDAKADCIEGCGN